MSIAAFLDEHRGILIGKERNPQTRRIARLCEERRREACKRECGCGGVKERAAIHA
jgi:hypothetical protein